MDRHDPKAYAPPSTAWTPGRIPVADRDAHERGDDDGMVQSAQTGSGARRPAAIAGPVQ